MSKARKTRILAIGVFLLWAVGVAAILTGHWPPPIGVAWALAVCAAALGWLLWSAR